MSKGYTEDQINKMTLRIPTLYNLSEQNLNNKLNFYNNIGLDNKYFINNTGHLIQGVELSIARHTLFQDLGIDMNLLSKKMLFRSNEAFTNLFNISNAELKEMYKEEIEETISSLKQPKQSKGRKRLRLESKGG